MSETTTGPTALASQYSAQVAGDLERNLKEQERIDGEIEALQAQLTALQQDHAILVNVQQALGVPASPADPSPASGAAVPAPRRGKAAAAPARKKQAQAGKSATPARKRNRKSTAEAPAAQSAQPTLVDLVREHLTGQSEPRSAAEITTALEQLHPDRTVKTTVVRTTLEGLVAKNQAQRTKQGKSVYYTTAAPADSIEQSD
ncbi:hypothetical protein M2155_007989 [Streptomyces sp. SAI-119]|uniref:BlaI/MecI/CopY family transcriptional regulator n=1 Tax=Streptomyces sp. SAI-119 TaxID=2940541 RepID=UPI002474EBAC|nr:BlaI/MecI/CopY family transcriptional regulator [Streptomyces sp. SAI-119]MDH6455490.1 hypothetical protein [Streptomyces sp. SAI-119]